MITAKMIDVKNVFILLIGILLILLGSVLALIDAMFCWILLYSLAPLEGETVTLAGQAFFILVLLVCLVSIVASFSSSGILGLGLLSMRVSKLTTGKLRKIIAASIVIACLPALVYAILISF